MSVDTHTAPAAQTGAIFQRLSLLDRFLPLWIGLAMAAGVLLGAIFPDIQSTFDSLRIDTVSFPIANSLPGLAALPAHRAVGGCRRPRGGGITLRCSRRASYGSSLRSRLFGSPAAERRR